MVMLHCRVCGTEIASDAREKKCKNCGELFPFECAVCGKHLRPPIPDFPVEKYFTDDNRPLCQDHYQRECPECGQWFRADENPGFFMCPACAAKREQAVAANAQDEDEQTRAPASSRALPGCSILIGAWLFAATIMLHRLAAWLLGA